MKTKTCLLVLVICLAVTVCVGQAEEKYGVMVYPGAQYDGDISEFLKQMSPQSAAYRTNDGVDEVIRFYQKQEGMKLFGEPTKEGAMFRKDKMDVAIQSPWMNNNTGKMMKDTLISIVKQPE